MNEINNKYVIQENAPIQLANIMKGPEEEKLNIAEPFILSIEHDG